MKAILNTLSLLVGIHNLNSNTGEPPSKELYKLTDENLFRDYCNGFLGHPDQSEVLAQLRTGYLTRRRYTFVVSLTVLHSMAQPRSSLEHLNHFCGEKMNYRL